MLPFNLHTGLTLEDTGLTLRWCDQRDVLTESADYWQPSGDNLLLVWKSRRMLGGLRGNATTTLSDAVDAKPKGFRLGLSNSDYVGQTLAQAYNVLQSELVTRLGRPHDRLAQPDSAKALWKFDGLTVRHEYWDGFGGDHYVLVYRTSRIPINKPVHLNICVHLRILRFTP